MNELGICSSEKENYRFVLDNDDIRMDFLFMQLREVGLDVERYNKGVDYKGNNHLWEKYIFLLSPQHRLNQEFLASLPYECMVFAYFLPNECKEIVENRKIELQLYASDAIFMYQNAKLTAEGILGQLIASTDMGLGECRVLVLGGGRIAKSLAQYLLPLCTYACFATKDEDELGYLATLSHHICQLKQVKNVIGDFDVIVNTIPKSVLGHKEYSKMNKNTVIFEIASPNGVDKTLASRNGIKVVTLGGLPSIVAPKTAGKLIRDCVLRQLNWK